MSIDVNDFVVKQDEDVDLEKRPTRVKPVYESKADYKKLLREHTKQLSKLQAGLYAANTYALLLIFQAMDTAGKDGAIRHVMSGVNPQGCQVFSFKHPSPTELNHDFLWRTTLCLPERGRIGIFNRSYYEEVLITRVHPELLQAEELPPETLEGDGIWRRRYDSIRDYEQHLHRSGTRVLKFFLHISQEEQRQRLLARIDDPKKNWKFSIGDVEERQFWDQYQDAYAKALGATSTHDSRWYIVPADDKKNARLFISQAVLEALESLHAKPPELPPERMHQLEEGRQRLEK